MSKRNSKESGNNFFSPAKKKRLDITFESWSKNENKPSSSKKQEADVWGDDFQEDVLEELDMVASQAFSQEVNISVDESFSSKVVLPVKTIPKPTSNWPQVPSFTMRNHIPSPKKSSISIKPSSFGVDNFSKPSTSNSNDYKLFSSNESPFKEPGKIFQEKKSSHVTHIFKNGNSNHLISTLNETISNTQSTQAAFQDFEKKLLNRNNMNSTMLSQKSVVVVSDDLQMIELSKLKEEKKKLLNELQTKDGEVVFLRKQLQQERKKLENEKLEKSRIIEEQENKHRMELTSIQKEKENITTQLNFQNLQLNSWKEKTKIMQKGSVKFVEPHSANTDYRSRSRINTTIDRSGHSVPIKLKDCATQAKTLDKSIHELKSSISVFPLKGIPKSIFEISEPEKPIVDIHIVEKIGKRNLPILQEAEAFRIFENSELVKPIVSFVNNKPLSIQFFLSNLTTMLNKTEVEINSRESISTINKIVATTRELLLNTLTSLKKILDAMKNDDVRDMNDFYYSTYYTAPVSHIESIWDAKRWYEKERGVDIRRSIAVLSCIVLTSTYLGEYITGKRRLKTDEDYSYSLYSQQMKTYNSWSNKDCDFEFLEMILQFVTVLALTRRVHQFSGVINAITQSLSNAQKSTGFCSTGLEYVFKIFREIVFSRPLLVCFESISEMLMIFGSCAKFSKKLCTDASCKAVNLNNNTWYFKPGSETCTLEIYLVQISNFTKDPITIINITHAIVSFMETILPMNVLPWKEEQRNSCQCCVPLIRFTVKVLYECTEINVEELEMKFQKSTTSRNDSKILHQNFWDKLRKKQRDIVIKGIRFLSYLLIRESDYVMRRTDMENAFHLFLHRVKNMKNLRLHENDVNILESLEIQDKAESSEKLQQISQTLTQTIGEIQVPVALERKCTAQRINKSLRHRENL